MKPRLAVKSLALAQAVSCEQLLISVAFFGQQIWIFSCVLQPIQSLACVLDLQL